MTHACYYIWQWVDGSYHGHYLIRDIRGNGERYPSTGRVSLERDALPHSSAGEARMGIRGSGRVIRCLGWAPDARHIEDVPMPSEPLRLDGHGPE